MTQPELDPLSDLFVRLEEIEREALKNVLPPKYVITDEWPYAQSTFPYIVNRWQPSVSGDLSEDVAIADQRVGIRVLVNPMTDSNRAGRMHQLYGAAYRLMAYFKAKPDLRTPTKSTPWWLSPEGVTIEGWRGSELFQMGGVQTPQTGVELTLVVPMFLKVF